MVRSPFWSRGLDRDTVRVLCVGGSTAERTAEGLDAERDRFETVAAADAAAGREELADTEFHCVVSGIELPDSDGLELLDTVRETDPTLPFVVYTDAGDEALASEALGRGATDYVPADPASPDYAHLAERVTDAVDQYWRTETRKHREQQLRELADQTDDVLWMVSADWSDVYFMNRAFEDVWGVCAEALDAGEVEILEAVHPDDRDRARAAMQQLSAGDPVDIELRVNADEAFGRWVWVQGHPVEEDGTVERIAGLSRDITGRKAREQELREERSFIEQSLAALEDIFYVVDPDTRFRRWNDRLKEVTGYSDEEIAAMTLEEFFPPDRRADALATFEEVLETGEVTTQGVIETADGERLPYEFTGTTLTDPDGEIRGVVGIGRDISERKARQRELRDQKEKIAALHDVGTTMEDCETAAGVYETVVDAAEDVLDFDIAIVNEVDGEFLVPQAVSSHLDSDDYYGQVPVDAERSDAATAYREGEPILVDDLRERDVVPADSEFRSALTVPLGEAIVFQSVSREAGAFDEDDLELVELLGAHAQARLGRIETEQRLRRRTEELAQQNDRLEEFASIVSHDLRNPLNVASGRLELAQREVDNEHLDEVARAHDRMATLIDDLLTLAREAKELSNVETVSLAETVKRCWRTVETGDATLDVAADQSVEADPNRLRQLLENLIRNSVEHGGADVTVRVGPLEDSAGFYVADDGPGIPPDEREDVFEPGYSTAEEGTGFGLAIVRRVAEAHDWAVSITESDAGGARFEIAR